MSNLEDPIAKAERLISSLEDIPGTGKRHYPEEAEKFMDLLPGDRVICRSAGMLPGYTRNYTILDNIKIGDTLEVRGTFRYGGFGPGLYFKGKEYGHSIHNFDIIRARVGVPAQPASYQGAYQDPLRQAEMMAEAAIRDDTTHYYGDPGRSTPNNCRAGLLPPAEDIRMITVIDEDDFTKPVLISKKRTKHRTLHVEKSMKVVLYSK